MKKNNKKNAKIILMILLFVFLSGLNVLIAKADVVEINLFSDLYFDGKLGYWAQSSQKMSKFFLNKRGEKYEYKFIDQKDKYGKLRFSDGREAVPGTLISKCTSNISGSASIKYENSSLWNWFTPGLWITTKKPSSFPAVCNIGYFSSDFPAPGYEENLFHIEVKNSSTNESKHYAKYFDYASESELEITDIFKYKEGKRIILLKENFTCNSEKGDEKNNLIYDVYKQSFYNPALRYPIKCDITINPNGNAEIEEMKLLVNIYESNTSNEENFEKTVKKGEKLELVINHSYKNLKGETIKLVKKDFTCRNETEKEVDIEFEEDNQKIIIDKMEENLFCFAVVKTGEKDDEEDVFDLILNIINKESKKLAKKEKVKKGETKEIIIDQNDVAEKYTFKCNEEGYAKYDEKTKIVTFSNIDKNVTCDLDFSKEGNSGGGETSGEGENEEDEKITISLTLANGSFAIGSSRKREFSMNNGETNGFELVITPNPKAIPKLRADQGTVKCVGRTTARFVNSTFTVEKPKKSDECTLTLDESGEHLVELLPDEKSVEMASLISKSVETGKTITFNNINPKAGYDINKAEFICKTTDGQTVELGTNTPGYEVKTSTFLVVNVTASLKCDFKFKEETDEDPNAVMVHFEFINATSEGKSKYTKSFSEEGQVTFVPNKGYTTIKPILECGVGINSDNEGNIYIFPELMEKKEIGCIVEARIDTGEETPTGDYNVELQYVDGTDGLGNKYDTISVNHGETANIFIQGNYLIDKDKKEHKSGIELKKIDCTGDYSTAKIIFEDSKYLVRVEDVESHILCKLDVIKDAGSEYKFTFDINNGSFIKPYVPKFSSSEIGIYTLTIEVGTEVYRKNEDIYTYSEKDILCNIERNKKQENINFELKEGIITIGQVDGNVRCVLTIPGEDDPDALLGLNETCFENEYSLKDKYNDAPASYENAYSRCCEIEGSEEKMGTIVYNRLCGKQVCESDNVRNLCQPDSTKGYIYEAGKTESGDALKGINKENYKCIMSGKRSEEGNRFELSKDECPNCGNYCTIYCKEDLETIFPGVGYNPKSGSSVNSGEYFTFKPYQDKDKTYDFLPYISQQRTCLYYADITSFSKDVYGTESLNNLTNIKGGYYKEAEMILKEYYSALEEVKKAEESLKEYENRKCIVAYENNGPISPINYKAISKNNSINYLLLDSQKSTITQLSNNNNDRCTEEKIGCRCCDKYEWVGSERKCVDFGKYSSWKSDDPEIYTTLTKEECENKAYKTEFEKTEVKYTSNFCEVKTSIRECNSKIETDAEQKKAKESCEKELKNNINTAKEIKKEKTELLDKLKEDYERITLRIKKTIEEFSNCTSYNNSYEEMDIPQISNFRYDEKDLISDLTIQNIDLEIKEDGSEIVFSPPLKYCDNDFNCQETNLKDIKLPVLKKHIENSSANGLNDFLSNQKDKDLETKVFSMAISTTSMSQQYGLNQELYAVKPTGRVVTRDGLVQLGADKYFNYNYLGYGIPIGLKTRAGNYGYSFKVSNLGRNNELFDEFSEMNEDGVYMCSYFVRNLIMCPKTGCSPDGEYLNGLIDDLNLVPFIRKINIEDPERLEREDFNTNWTTEEGKSAITRMIEMGDKQFSDGPLYQFTVGASEIKKVRDYNKENSYSDFKLKCNEEGKECQSEFVTEFSDTEITAYGRGNWIYFDQEEPTP